METVTCTAPVNIAVIKYWGKRNETLILPTNSSLSVTLCQDQLRAKTTVAMSRSFMEDKLWLNGKEQPMDNPRVQNVLREMRRRARKRKLSRDDEETGGCDWRDWHVHICSENNFPTAAGLASSAAGYACLVFALSNLFKIEGDISEIARRGSGSACRSIYGGFVEWDMGDKEDGSDSVARQVAPETHWPELRVLILVVSGKKKHIGSTAGMQTTVKTSDLLTYRVTDIVPQRMTAMKEAIDKKDFNNFAEITMKDSNQFHAVCLDTYPPISYMTDVSRDIIRIVHAVNKFYGTKKICYTYDAGPNACLYLLESDVALTLSIMQHFFPSPCENGDNYVKGLEVTPTELPNDLLSSVPLEPQKGAVQYIISTKAGCGPQVLGAAESLLGTDGLPKES